MNDDKGFVENAAPPTVCQKCKRALCQQTSPPAASWKCRACGDLWFSRDYLDQHFSFAFIHDLLMEGDREAEPKEVCPNGHPLTAIRKKLYGSELTGDYCFDCQLLRTSEEIQEVLDKTRTETNRELLSPWSRFVVFLGLPSLITEKVQKIRPITTWSIAALALCISWQAFGHLHYEALRFGFIPSQPLRFGGLTLLTSFFLHTGWYLLISNLFFFLIFAPELENDLGPLGLILILALCTATANLMTILANSGPSSMLPQIGASGGVFGVMICHMLRFPRERLGWVTAAGADPMVGAPMTMYWYRSAPYFYVVIMIVAQSMGWTGSRIGFVGTAFSPYFGGAVGGFICYLAIARRKVDAG